MKFPEITQQDIEDAKQRMKQDIFAITWCRTCTSENFGFRLGCCELGNVEHYWKTHDGRYLTEKDVCILPQPYSEHIRKTLEE